MIRAVLTDIEGTTSSLSFVKDVLFPYARERMSKFVREHAGEAAVGEQLDAVRAEQGRAMTDIDVVQCLVHWIDEDRKVTALKVLQGMIWEAGYRDGDFTGHVYEDAVRNLRQWHRRGIKLYVFSSGSVYAQQLLFAHSDAGDLTPLFSGYYDTRIGAKRQSDAYVAIAHDIGLPPSEILFLSDIEEELDAAQVATMRTVWLRRDGRRQSDTAHIQVLDFDAIQLAD